MIETSTQPRQSWWRAAPLPEPPEPFSLDAMVGHFAAMYVAHAEAYHEAVSAESRKLAGADGPEREVIGAALRTAIVRHLQPMQAAWTVAALLKGMTAEQAWECYQDQQAMDEWGWEWLIKATDLPDEQIRALTTVPVKGEDGLY